MAPSPYKKTSGALFSRVWQVAEPGAETLFLQGSWGLCGMTPAEALYSLCTMCLLLSGASLCRCILLLLAGPALYVFGRATERDLPFTGE